MKQVLSVVLRNQADTLVRLAGLCYRRGVPIESLSYATESVSGQVRFRAVLACGLPAAQRLHHQVSQLVGVVGSDIAPYYEGGM